MARSRPDLTQASTLLTPTRSSFATSRGRRPGDFSLIATLRTGNAAMARALQQRLFDGFEVTQELIVGAESGNPTGFGFTPEPTEWHAEATRDDVQR
jgi:hypothetical protein